jgi:RNA polymerase sigma-70 factor (ECF subfamily)
MTSAAFQAMLESTVTAYERRLVGYAFRVLHDHEEARDAAQETLMKLCRLDPATFEREAGGHLEAWLFTVCRNAALDRLRKSKRMFHTEDGSPAPVEAGPGPAQQAETHEETDRVQALLATLSPRQREVVHLKFHTSLSYEEIANLTGMTVNNVGVTLHLALKNLRKKMEEGQP